MARDGFICCYGCDLATEAGGLTGARLDVMAVLYEHVVEEVERCGGRRFTLVQVWERASRRPISPPPDVLPTAWRRFGDTVSLYPIAGQVLRDMAEHGLVQCIRKSRGQRLRCLEWQLLQVECP